MKYKLSGGYHGGEEREFPKSGKISLPIENDRRNRNAIYELREHDSETGEKVGIFIGTDP